MNEIRKAMEKFVEEQDTFARFEELYKNCEISSSDEASSSSDEIEKKFIDSATTLGFYSEKGIAIKGVADRKEIDLDSYAIRKIIHRINDYNLGVITYGEKKWTYTSDEETLNTEILHTLIDLYDKGITPDKIWMDGKTFTPLEFIDFIYMKKAYFIFIHWHTYEKGFFHIYHGYASKMLLIDGNKSNIFNKWNKIAPISKSAFLEGVRWICGDTSPEESHYTRAIALTPDGVVKLVAIHTESGYKYFDEKGKNFSGAHFKRKAITEKEKSFADEKGEISSFCKIILSSKDKI